MATPYKSLGTGELDNLIQMTFKKDIIACTLCDDDDNRFPAIVEIEVTNFEVKVISVNCTGENLNNPTDDIRSAIKEKYKTQIITWN